MKTLLCYGDSNTYGYAPRTGGRYPVFSFGCIIPIKEGNRNE